MSTFLDLASTMFIGYFAVLIVRNRANMDTIQDTIIAMAWIFANAWVLGRLWVHL